MLAVYKQSLRPYKAVHEIELPGAAKILSVQNQNEELAIWYLCDPELNHDVKRRLLIILTGEWVDSNHVYDKYLGTVQFEDGKYVVHVFEELK